MVMCFHIVLWCYSSLRMRGFLLARKVLLQVIELVCKEGSKEARFVLLRCGHIVNIMDVFVDGGLLSVVARAIRIKQMRHSED